MTARSKSTLFNSSGARLYTIPAHLPFLQTLAQGVRDGVAALDGADIADSVIYLPTRRAARVLADAFLENAPTGASLLPTIRAVGDTDEDEFTLFSGDAEDEIDLPPAVSPVERRMTLARLVAAKDRAFSGQERWAGALAAADQLGLLLDSFYTEEISPRALKTLAADELAGHWARSLAFLDIVIEAWPAHLEAVNRMDPADRRAKLIDRRAKAYRAHPPRRPVIVAGSTGSTPSVARLMQAVMALPLGGVVLPGVDLAMDDGYWRVVDDPHPQSGLKHLIEVGLGLDRSAVQPWPGTAPARGKRDDMIAVALRPAAASDSWLAWTSAFNAGGGSAIENLELVEAENEEREADAVALKIRETIEQPGKTVALTTPDRDLARRVSMKLRRWNIVVDDSGGVPFANTPSGGFLRLTARWIAAPTDAVALVAMLRHPLFGGSLNDQDRRRAVDGADMALRGLPAYENLSGLANGRADESAQALLTRLDALLQAAPQASDPFAAHFAFHLAVSERLAARENQPGADRLWRGDDGEAGASSLAQIQPASGAISIDQQAEYPDIFDQLIAGVSVRRSAPAHPRISIFGPLEARLQHADVMILGGLNEGVWPRDAAIDPFLSRGMRSDIGLPSPERRIGLAAHDFAQLTGAPSVMLTRAKKTGGNPATPSRWVVRLKNMLEGAGCLAVVDRTRRYQSFAQCLDDAEPTTIAAPAPRPPVDARPTAFSVTRIETLLRDPYAVYARSILGVRKLGELNEPVDLRHIGNLFHSVFEQYVKDDPPAAHDARLSRLHEIFNASAARFGLGEDHLAFWRARAGAAFDWFATWDGERRVEGAPAVIEGAGAYAFDLDGRRFALNAKADRIDRLHDGSAAIFDYKTGAPPPTDAQQTKFSPQLALTGLIAQQGGFEDLGAVEISRFEYVKVLGRKNDGKDHSGASGDRCRDRIEEARVGLFELLTHFQDPQSPYPSQPRAQFVDDYGDYDHLARRRERRAREDEP